MEKPKILVILASTREVRMGEKVANWVMGELSKRDDANYELVDLKDYPLPNYDEIKTPKMLKPEEYKSETARKWITKVEEADGYLLVTPEYNHGYTAALKNALDYPFYQWNKKPIAFVSYGGPAGGARAVEQIRLVAVELDMVPTRDAVLFPLVSSKFDDNGNLTDPGYHDRLKACVGELLWWVNTLKAGRASLNNL